MRFLKENTFLTVLMGVVVVSAVVLLGFVSKNSAVSKELDKRKNVAGELTNVVRGKLVGPKAVDSSKVSVKLAEKMSKELRQEDIEWNRRNLEVLELPIPGRDPIDAFPLQENLYEQYGLRYTFRTQYGGAILSLRQTLKPVLLSEDQIAAEIAKEQKRIESELMHKAALERKEEDEGAESGSTVRPRGSVDAGIAARAAEQARENVTIRLARRGRMFVDQGAMDDYWADVPFSPMIAFDKLWEAQVNLWVHQEIFRAINTTNSDVLGAGGKSDDVVNAPIKRLVSVTINASPLDNSLPGEGTGKARTRDAEYMPPIPPMMIPQPGGGYKSAGGGGPTKASVTVTADTLTQRVSNTDYDVTRYAFTVVMPSRFLPQLQRNLLASNHHTILDVDMVPLGGEGTAGSGQAGFQDYHYYGPEPVVTVTIRGELLLLTAWERGTWDDKEHKWVYPPLMPKQMLGRFQAEGRSAALRPEDTRRLQQTSALAGR